MNHSEDKVFRAFRDLSANAPKNAPAELGANLKCAFRRHHNRRKRIRAIGTIATLAACIALVAFVTVKETRLFVKHDTTRTMAAKSDSKETPAPTQITVSTPESPTNSIHRHASAKRASFAGNHRNTNANLTIAKGFTPLPTYDPGLPVSGYQVVRVGLQETALSQLGLPVRENNSNQRVVTDLLVDRDGMPMAYRLVGAMKTR
jgi:hypothetical protein